ncbi:MAG TPA: hypothetical protein VLT33_37705 [Labilithrix sp.]|nr:hypothetical protein [Labilithrix sp.]
MRRTALSTLFLGLPLTACAALASRDEPLAQREQAIAVADATPADATDADSALEQCVLERVGDRLRRCCRRPGALDTCYDIADGTMAACGDAGPDGGPGGMVGTISCPGVDWYLPFALVYVAGQGWCAVKTEGDKPTVYACKPSPDDFLVDFPLACTIAGVETDGGPCPCTIRNVTTTPIGGPKPSSCTTTEGVHDARSCHACCAAGWRRECSDRGYPDTGEWQLQYLQACDAYRWSDAGADAGRVIDASTSKAVMP